MKEDFNFSVKVEKLAHLDRGLPFIALSGLLFELIY